MNHPTGYDVAALREAEFPVSKNSVYLNHAGISPLPRRSFEIIREANERMMLDPGGSMMWAFAQMGRFSKTLAALINAALPEEVVFVPSTSVAFNLVASAMPWQAGENIVLCDVEFPANVYPWMQAARTHGLELRFVPAEHGGLTPEAVDRAVDAKTRLVAASSVQFLSGHRTDLAAIGAICAARGVLFSVDCIQSGAHIPIDVQAMHIDILAAGGFKSLMGPVGTGFLYVRRALAETMQPAIVSGNSVVDYQWWLHYDMTPAEGTARFGTGSSNFPGMIGLTESVAMLHEIGIPAIDAYTTGLIDYAIEGLRRDGCTAILTPAAHGPIVTFKAADTDAETTAIVEALAKRSIYTIKHWDAARTAYLRASVHCYNTREEIDRLLTGLREVKAL